MRLIAPADGLAGDGSRHGEMAGSLGGRPRFRRVPAPLPWSCWKTAFLDLYGWSSGGGVADERKATTQAWRWGRDRAVLAKLTIRMARRVDELHEGFARAKARTKPTNRDND